MPFVADHGEAGGAGAGDGVGEGGLGGVDVLVFVDEEAAPGELAAAVLGEAKGVEDGAFVVGGFRGLELGHVAGEDGVGEAKQRPGSFTVRIVEDAEREVVAPLDGLAGGANPVVDLDGELVEVGGGDAELLDGFGDAGFVRRGHGSAEEGGKEFGEVGGEGDAGLGASHDVAEGGADVAGPETLVQGLFPLVGAAVFLMGVGAVGSPSFRELPVLAEGVVFEPDPVGEGWGVARVGIVGDEEVGPIRAAVAFVGGEGKVGFVLVVDAAEPEGDGDSGFADRSDLDVVRRDAGGESFGVAGGNAHGFEGGAAQGEVADQVGVLEKGVAKPVGDFAKAQGVVLGEAGQAHGSALEVADDGSGEVVDGADLDAG